MNEHQITAMKAKLLSQQEQQERIEEMQKYHYVLSESTKYLHKVIDTIKEMK